MESVWTCSRGRTTARSSECEDGPFHGGERPMTRTPCTTAQDKQGRILQPQASYWNCVTGSKSYQLSQGEYVDPDECIFWTRTCRT